MRINRKKWPNESWNHSNPPHQTCVLSLAHYGGLNPGVSLDKLVMWPSKPCTPNSDCILWLVQFFFSLAPLCFSTDTQQHLWQTLKSVSMVICWPHWWWRGRTVIKRVCCSQIGFDKHAANKVPDRNVWTRENIKNVHKSMLMDFI